MLHSKQLYFRRQVQMMHSYFRQGGLTTSISLRPSSNAAGETASSQCYCAAYASRRYRLQNIRRLQGEVKLK